MADTKIEWCDKTWNVVTGCSKVSRGCQHCYAERMAPRLAGRFGYPASNPFKVTIHPDRLEEPLHWKKSQIIFPASMGDLFHLDVPTEFIQQVFSIMKAASWHTFMILTKRPDRMLELTRFAGSEEPALTVPDNVWLGTSVEDQATANERVLYLLQSPAKCHFVSYEPALGMVDFHNIRPVGYSRRQTDALRGVTVYENSNRGAAFNDLPKLDLVILGFMSGPGAIVPLGQLSIARFTRDQCQANDVAFFLKQMWIDGHLVKMPSLDGQVWNQFPKDTP